MKRRLGSLLKKSSSIKNSTKGTFGTHEDPTVPWFKGDGSGAKRDDNFTKARTHDGKIVNSTVMAI